MGQLLPRYCKHCKEDHLAQFSHRGRTGGNLIYVDETGRLWKGSLCPKAQAAIRKEQRKSRNIASKEPESSTGSTNT